MEVLVDSMDVQVCNELPMDVGNVQALPDAENPELEPEMVPMSGSQTFETLVQQFEGIPDTHAIKLHLGDGYMSPELNSRETLSELC